MLQSACVARIDGQLLIEIDFGTGPVSSGTGVDGGGRNSGRKKTSVSGEMGQRIRIGPSEPCSDEDLRLSNFISVQVGAGTLGNRDDHPNSHGRLLTAVATVPIGFSRITSHTHIRTRQPSSTSVTSITVSKFLTRVPAHPIFNANHLVTFYGVRSPNRPPSTSIHGACEPPRIDSLPPAIHNCAPNCINKSCFSRKDLPPPSPTKELNQVVTLTVIVRFFFRRCSTFMVAAPACDKFIREIQLFFILSRSDR